MLRYFLPLVVNLSCFMLMSTYGLAAFLYALYFVVLGKHLLFCTTMLLSIMVMGDGMTLRNKNRDMKLIGNGIYSTAIKDENSLK